LQPRKKMLKQNTFFSFTCNFSFFFTKISINRCWNKFSI